jgi:hypothetical protein
MEIEENAAVPTRHAADLEVRARVRRARAEEALIAKNLSHAPSRAMATPSSNIAVT